MEAKEGVRQVRRFEDLDVWQRARVLTQEIYGLTKQKPLSADFGLRDQIQRASVSVMSNVAEGFERGSNKEFAQFVFIAKGSVGEVRSLLYVALDQQYIDEQQFKKMFEDCVRVSQLCWGLIRHLQRHSGWKTGLAITLLMLCYGLKSLVTS